MESREKRTSTTEPFYKPSSPAIMPAWVMPYQHCGVGLDIDALIAGRDYSIDVRDRAGFFQLQG
jgi:hypothetical protein